LEGVAGKALRDLDASTRLAADRTRLAYERTLMAWVRTATTLITFGFAPQKSFQDQKTATEGRLLGPHNLALLMIASGWRRC
jgi:putative membrane protein